MFKYIKPISFEESLEISSELTEQEKVDYYYSDKIKVLFNKYIASLEQRLKDALPFVRLQTLKVLIELFDRCPDSEKEVLSQFRKLYIWS